MIPRLAPTTRGGGLTFSGLEWLLLRPLESARLLLPADLDLLLSLSLAFLSRPPSADRLLSLHHDQTAITSQA